MLKTIAFSLLPLLVFFGSGTDLLFTGFKVNPRKETTGTLEKMIVAGGNVSLDLGANRFGAGSSGKKGSNAGVLRFDLERDAFFTVLVFNGELRGPVPGSVGLITGDPAGLPGSMRRSYADLVLEYTEWGEPYELVVRNSKTGFVYFNIEGQAYGFDKERNELGIEDGRLLISREFAAELGREPGSVIGHLSLKANMRPIEVTHVVDGAVVSDVLPAAEAGGVPGPDVIVGNLFGLAQFGSASGTQVGLAVGTDSCNAGAVDLNWFALPSNDHPVIPQNLYRMSGGPANDERFEQIGQSNVKHAFTALTQDICGFGCNGVGGSRLGSGCSDPYSASLNAGPSLGSRAWINPFTGFYPRGDSATPPNAHSGHTHTGPSHRVLTEINDLNTALNPGATYYAEAQYITPHEYAWCQTNPGQCNMYNNVSYRRYNVSGTGSPFSFSPAAATVRAAPAVSAWPGATFVEIRPDPGNDGVGLVAYKVTNTAPGVWHYEYAIYNQNLDRGIRSFSVPVAGGVTLNNIGFRSPPQHPGWTGDGTVGNTGYSSMAWEQIQTANSLTWTTEAFSFNQNANAIRWGTMYNFRFDSNRAPQTANATIGFFKTGNPITVQVQVPSGPAASVSISGRVTTAGGMGVGHAWVSISDAGGNARLAMTNGFGFYRFDEVVPGAMYTLGVSSKRYTFTPRTIPVNDNLSDIDFVAEP